MIYQKFLTEEGSVHGTQLNRGFSALRFESVLEQEFRTSLANTRIGQLRVSMVILLVASMVFLGVDLIANGGHFSNTLIGLRAVVSQTLMLAMLSVCHGKIDKRWLEPFGIALALNVGPLAFVGNELVGGRTGIQAQLVSYVTSSFFVYFCFGLRFWHSVAISGLLCLGYAADAIVLAGGVNVASVYPILLLMVPNGIGALVAYQLEYHERQRFLMEWELKFQANHDQLTGLWNRRALHDHLTRTWAHCNREQQRLSLALIDIDYFKNYNDTYGHIKGDAALAELGSMLRTMGQRPLDLVARYGGEEFAVLLPNCSLAQAERIMKQFQDKLAERKLAHSSSRVSPYMTVSIGLVSVMPKLATVEFNKLFNCADKALYEAKSRGRNGLVVYNQLEQAANDQCESMSMLAKTIPFTKIAGTTL